MHTVLRSNLTKTLLQQRDDSHHCTHVWIPNKSRDRNPSRFATLFQALGKLHSCEINS